MSNFDPNAILRGAQLTVVGAYRALQNPGLFKYDHYRQAAIAVCAGIVIRLVIGAPIVAIKVVLQLLSYFIDFQASTWDDKLVGGLDFLANSVLQVPFFLMSLMRYITPTLDQMFMESLQWVDQTYIQKHKSEDPKTLRAMYYPNLRMYSTHGDTSKHRAPMDAAIAFLMRFGRRAAISLAVYLLSYLPVVGRFVLPAASFYTVMNAAGPIPATVIFGSGIFLPRRYLVVFLQSYFSSRSLVRELLEPYFSRVRFTKAQKRAWFRDREGILFGFGVGFWIFLRIPLLGVLIYGIAEASTAFLITKITDPPPSPAYSSDFAESQLKWRNKHEFLKLPLANLDAHNVHTDDSLQDPMQAPELPGKKFS
ncbi:transmembrane protein [Lasallia pustulata]|uniref:Transmembrane protein n=1 Tax=Lasallia pustulata TaxID=136370 RepID=A0A1W5DE36_9LECA|nr:transmembrane protein [Lasallia pustulata]